MKFSFVFCVIPLIFGKPTLSDTVSFIEDNIKALKGRLFLIAEPFPSLHDSKKYLKRAVTQCAEILKDVRIEELVPVKIDKRYYISLIVLIFLLFILGPELVKIRTHPEILYVESPTVKSTPTLILAEANPLNKLYLITETEKIRMSKLGSNRFAAVINPDNSIDVYVGYRCWASGKEKVNSVPELNVKELILEYNFPEYINVKPEYDTVLRPQEFIKLRALIGTNVAFTGITNVPVGKLKGEVLKREIAGNRFRGLLNIKRDEIIEVEITDTIPFLSNSLRFEIMPIIDNSPHIIFLYPTDNYKLDESMRVPIHFRTEDDYGLDRIDFIHGKMSEKLGELMGLRFFEDSINLEIENLLPGETLSVKLKVSDIAGNISVSPPVYIYMPALEELFSNYGEINDTLKNMVSEYQVEEEKIMEKIEEFIDRNDINTEIKYDLTETLRRQKKLLESIDKMREFAQKMQNQFIIEELKRINELLDEMNIDNIYRQLENIENKKDFSKKELYELNLSQEKLLKALKLGRKSLESLKDLMELNEFIRRTEEIYDKQSEISRNKPSESLAAVQKEQREELSKMLDEMIKSSNSEFKDIGESMRATDVEKNMDDITMLMKMGKMNKEIIRDVMNSLEYLHRNLLDIQEERTGEKIVKEIREKAWELGFILREHDKLIGKNAEIKLGLIEQGLSEGVGKIKNDLEKIFIISFAFSPEVLNNLVEAEVRMKELSEEITRSVPPVSSMERVNDLLIESIILLFSQPPASSLAMINKMNQILNQQKKIHNQLQQIIPMPGKSGYKILRELSQKQRNLAEEVRRMGDALKPLAGEMDKIAQQMESGKFDNEVIERQRDILERLLEASKSLRRKEISKRRRSRPGIFVKPSRKITVPEDMGEKKKELRDILKRNMEEPYPEVFESEIREYIRRLLE